MSLTSAVFAVVFGGVSLGCLYLTKRLDRKKVLVTGTPFFTTIQQVEDYVRMNGGRAYLNFNALSASPAVGPGGVIVKDCEIKEIIESWTYHETTNRGTEPPGGASTTTTTGQWVRSTMEPVMSSRSSNREQHPLQLTDSLGRQMVTVDPASFRTAIDSENIWSNQSEEYQPIGGGIGGVNVNLSLNFSSSSSSSSQPPAPRTIGHRHLRRELRVDEPLYALGDVILSPVSEGTADALTFTMEADDSSHPVALCIGTRADYLESMSQQSRVSTICAWIFGALSSACLAYYTMNRIKPQ